MAIIDAEVDRRDDISTITGENSIIIEETTPHSLLGTEVYYTKYTTSPCNCCGSTRHALLRKRHSGGSISMEAECPYITGLKIQRLGPSDRDETIRYEINVGRLAKTHYYNSSSAIETLNKIMFNGVIQHTTLNKVIAFRDALKEHCERRRSGTIWKEFREAPCKGCGSPFHGLLNYDTNERKHKYHCPCMKVTEGEHNSWYEDKVIRYLVCPLRLAKENRYDEAKVKVALNRHTDKGSGKFMRPDALRQLREEAISECRRHHEALHQNSNGSITGTLEGRYPLTRIVGIEGWEPLHDTSVRSESHEDQEVDIVSEVAQYMENHEIVQPLIVVALAILIGLLIYASKIIMEL